MKKIKLKLDQIKVESFTTSTAEKIKGGQITLIGGGPFGGCQLTQLCDPTTNTPDDSLGDLDCISPAPTTDCGGD
mgnify:CR=1 FL=1